MKISFWTSATLLALSTAAFGQQPAVYPLRSQNAAAQGVDSAYCYWQAKQQTGVDMTRLPQRPPRTKAARFAPDAGKGGSEPPLPRGAAGTNARAEKAGQTANGNAAAGGGASSVAPQPGVPSSSAAHAVAPSTAAPRAEASGPTQTQTGASGIGPTGTASATASASGSTASAASGAPSANLPPLPPPEPPMATYWHAYGDCMQARGYGVQ